MKKFLIFILFCVVLVSCYISDDDTNKNCIENCTIFSGQVKTVDEIGIPNVKLTLDYHIGGELSSYTRIIGKTKTDQNGFYEMSVYIKDKELGETSPGYFTLTLDPEKINSSLPEEYLKPNIVSEFKPEVNYYSISERNVTFENNFIIPKKGNISIKLKNFAPIMEGDFFNTGVSYNYSFLSGSWTNYQPFGGFSIGATANPTVLNCETILNGPIKIRVSKKKNGVFEIIEQEVVLDNPNVYELEFDY